MANDNVIVIDSPASMQDFIDSVDMELRVDLRKNAYHKDKLISIYKSKNNEVKTSKENSESDVLRSFPCLQRISKR